MTNVLCNLVSSIIYDIFKCVVKNPLLFSNEDKNIVAEIEEYVLSKMTDEYVSLSESSTFNKYLHMSLPIDVISNFIMYKVTGMYNNDILKIRTSKKISTNETLTEQNVLDYLVDNLLLLYKNDNALVIPDKTLLTRFFRMMLIAANEFIYMKMSSKDKMILYFMCSRFDSFFEKNNQRTDLLLATIATKPQYETEETEEKYHKTRNEYMKLLKDNNSSAHVYLLDTFDFNQFYVPPKLLSTNKLNIEMNEDIYFRKMIYDKFEGLEEAQFGNQLDDWKYIFSKNNIIYITGGAGFGKSLFMKKLINDYENINIVDATEYLVIYGELKSFYQSNSENPISMYAFLQTSIRSVTLLDESQITTDFVDFYLKRGRCIILLDALDEVEKTKRKQLHKMIINFFKSQNPNNKVCITSRNRGFIPEENIETCNICALDRYQIELYVDKIIALGKFNPKDKDVFILQTEVLIKKGFLSSFLVLSLLINIYKSERELPENKLELYQKCFEYISNRREKEKSQSRYHWERISPLMKDNTFMELANMCFPNNTDVDKEKIKEKLCYDYRTKFGNEVETEIAIDEFLAFCSDRTELFVPSSSEDKYNFFHRSFFEYFYSQYIFLRSSDEVEMFDKMSLFDIDSEIFELTIAMLKQKAEEKYQSLIKMLFQKANEGISAKQIYIFPFNILILSMQVVDDEIFKVQFIDFLIKNSKTIIANKKRIIFNEIIVSLSNQKEEFRDRICEEYDAESKREVLMLLIEISKKVRISKEHEGILRFANEPFTFFETRNEQKLFYVNIFLSKMDLKTFFEKISFSEVLRICKFRGSKAMIANDGFKKYKALSECNKEIVINFIKSMFI